MTVPRFLILLAAALIAIGGAVWISSQRHLPRARLAGDPVLGELKGSLNEITRVRLSKGDGSHATLLRRSKDWVVEERGYPADSGRVRKLLLDLAALAVVEEKTHDRRNYALLGVEDPQSAAAQGVLLAVDARNRIPPLIVGKPFGSKSVFVRRQGDEASFLAAPQLALDSDPKSWIDHVLLDVKAERVRDVTVTVPGAAAYMVMRRARSDADFTVTALPPGRSLSSPSAANAAGAALTALSIDDVRAATATTGGYRAVLRTFDGLALTVEGVQDGARRYIRPGARFEASAREPAAAPAAAPGAAPAAPPSAAEVEAEAAAIEARARGFEFEIPPYKFDALFRPLEELLAKPPAAPRRAAKTPGKP